LIAGAEIPQFICRLSAESDAFRREQFKPVARSPMVSRQQQWHPLLDIRSIHSEGERLCIRAIRSPSPNLPRSDRAAVAAAAVLPSLDIVNVNFFDWNGEIVYKGGAERYVCDLAVLLRSRGVAFTPCRTPGIRLSETFAASKYMACTAATITIWGACPTVMQSSDCSSSSVRSGRADSAHAC